MKSAILLFTTLFSAFAAAQEKDKVFLLADGHYALECWGLSVSASSDGTFEREQSYQKGTNFVSSANGVKSETLVFQNEDETQKYSMTRTTTTTDLGNGLFKQTMETKSDTKNATFEVQLKAEGFFNLMLSATWDDKPIDVKGREFTWKIIGDGRIFAQDYFLPTSNKLISATTCIFTPTK